MNPNKQVVHFSLASPAIIGLILAVILPWIILGLIVFKRPAKTASEIRLSMDNNESDAQRIHHPIESGPWGILDISRIIIQPPLSLINCNIDLQSYKRWTFNNTSLENIQQLFKQSGLNEEDIRTLSESAISKPEIKGFIIIPPDDLVGRMPPQVRGVLYTRLSLNAENTAQAVPFRFCGSSIYEWFDHSDVNQDIVEKIKPLIYKRGKYLLFSDLHLIVKDLKTTHERLQLLHTLCRASTLKVRIRGNSQNNDSILDYWSRGDRRNEIEPLMISIADQTQNMSIVVLLPTFARTRLYSYGATYGTTSKENDGKRDCHWTSFNFFNDIPDDRFAKTSMIPDILAREYDVIANPIFLGDVIMILHENTGVHSCVYIADDVVFTKNGSQEGDPFILEKLENVIELYQQQYGSVSLKFFRRKDIK